VIIVSATAGRAALVDARAPALLNEGVAGSGTNVAVGAGGRAWIDRAFRKSRILATGWRTGAFTPVASSVSASSVAFDPRWPDRRRRLSQRGRGDDNAAVTADAHVDEDDRLLPLGRGRRRTACRIAAARRAPTGPMTTGADADRRRRLPRVAFADRPRRLGWGRVVSPGLIR
jgi:hypothetical protein